MKNSPNTVVTAERSVTYSGPLPPAAEFERYERALPGTAGKLIEMAEREALVRQNNDTKALNEAVKLTRSGQYFAFVIAVLSLASIVICAFLNQPVMITAVPAILGCISLAAVFLDKKK